MSKRRVRVVQLRQGKAEPPVYFISAGALSYGLWS